MTSLFCVQQSCEVGPVPPKWVIFGCLVSASPLLSAPRCSAGWKTVGSLQTSGCDGLTGQELVTEPDRTSAFVRAWPLSWLLNERWINEPLKILLCLCPQLPFASWKTTKPPPHPPHLHPLLLYLHTIISVTQTCSHLHWVVYETLTWNMMLLRICCLCDLEGCCVHNLCLLSQSGSIENATKTECIFLLNNVQ